MQTKFKPENVMEFPETNCSARSVLPANNPKAFKGKEFEILNEMAFSSVAKASASGEDPPSLRFILNTSILFEVLKFEESKAVLKSILEGSTKSASAMISELAEFEDPVVVSTLVAGFVVR